MKRIMIIAAICSMAVVFTLFSQAGGTTAAVPDGFREIKIGLDVETVKERLMADPYFEFRADPDVSFSPQLYETILSYTGNYFIKEAFFQFYEKKLYIIILVLNEKYLDYYTMLTTLQGKYGGFSEFSPTYVVWDFDKIKLSLEKPLIVKYIDKDIFNLLQEKGQATSDFQAIQRGDFLQGF